MKNKTKVALLSASGVLLAGTIGAYGYLHIHGKAIKTYSESELSLARQCYQNSDFEQMEAHLKNIPAESPFSVEVENLKKQDPLQVKIHSLVPPELHIVSKQYTLLADGVPGIVVITENGDGFEKELHCFVYYYDQESQAYKPGYQSSQMGTDYRISFGKILGDDRTAVLITFVDSGGSGYSSDMSVIGYDPASHNLKTYLDFPNALNGTMEVLGRDLIVRTFDSKTKYTWTGNQLVGTPVSWATPTDPGDAIIHYSVRPDGVDVVEHSITMHLGQALDCVRTDSRQLADRVLLEDGRMWDDTGGKTVAKQPGKTAVTIIPNGYDWDHAVKVPITILP